MKKTVFMILAAVATATLASCSSNDDNNEGQSNIGTPEAPSGGTTGSGTAASLGELTSFAVAIDSTALSETDNVDASDEDYIENNTFAKTVYVNFSGTSATVSGTTDSISATVSGADVTLTATGTKVNYVVSGSTSDGYLKIYGDKKFSLTLNGVYIKNPDGAAINIQNKKRGYVALVSGTTNTLVDGTNYSDSTSGEKMKATLFSEGKLLFSGSGALRVYANAKNGICADDYILFRPGNNIYVKATASNGIKADDAIYIKGGVINVETSANGSKGLKTDGNIVISGGRTTAINTGSAIYDSSEQDITGAPAVKADSVIVNGGQLLAKATGKGGKAIKADCAFTMNSGEVYALTTGDTYTYSSSLDSKAKAVKVDTCITINGGQLLARTESTQEGAEAIESKGTLTVNAGVVEAYSYDDGINATNNITINGGYVYSYGANNDGIDSNGTLTITGGVAIAVGTTQPEAGFDCDQNTFTVTGGTLIGIGGDTSTPTTLTGMQPVIIVGGSSINSGTYITLNTSSGTNLMAFQVPRAYNQYTLLVSCAGMQTGSTYTISTGATVSGGTSWMGYSTGSTISGGTQLASLTLSSGVTSSGVHSGGGFGGDGFQPGGGGGNQGGGGRR